MTDEFTQHEVCKANMSENTHILSASSKAWTPPDFSLESRSLKHPEPYCATDPFENLGNAARQSRQRPLTTRSFVRSDSSPVALSTTSHHRSNSFNVFKDAPARFRYKATIFNDIHNEPVDWHAMIANMVMLASGTLELR